jgi:hypothetical protein
MEPVHELALGVTDDNDVHLEVAAHPLVTVPAEFNEGSHSRYMEL